MSNSCVSFSYRSGLVLAFVACLSLPGSAQQADPAVETDSKIELPTFTVRATLRTEPLLSVPLAISLMTGEQMSLANIQGLGDLSGSMPSLTFRAGGSNKDTSLLVRGVGTITTSPGVEPAVSTVVDGVVLARPGQATMDLAEVDHVEVLRGPQGTLFGKNSSAGVINVVTKDPSNKTQGYFDASYYGGGGQVVVRAGMSGALKQDKLKASVSFLYDNYDGNVENIFLSKTVNGFSNTGGRAKLIYTPHANFQATFIVSYVKSYSTTPNSGPFIASTNIAFPSGVVSNANPLAVAAILPVVASRDNLTVNSGLLGRVYDKNGGVSAQLEWTVGDYKVTSISSYQHWFNNQYQDTGVIPRSVVGLTVSWDQGFLWFDQYSQELRLTSPTGKFFNFVTGLYFQRALDNETYRRDIIRQPTAGNVLNDFGKAYYGTRGSNYSAYGEGTWNISPRLRAITGLRLTRDTLDNFHSRVSSSLVAVPGIQPAHAYHTGSTSANGTSGRGGLQYDLTKNTMVYATYSRGYKGPAYNVFFNQTPLQVGALAPETADSYEIGLKTLTLKNRLQLTLTAFDTVYHNYQANFQTLVVGTPVTNLINAGEVSSRGIEADVRARLSSRLTIFASLASIDAKIDHFNIPPPPASATNIDGQPLPFAPRFKSNVTADYTLPLAERRKLVFSANYAYQSSQQFSLTQNADTVQKAYGIWNASVAFSDQPKGWRVALIVKNIADVHYSKYIQQGGGFDWQIAPRDFDRYFGVSFHKDF